MTEIISEIGINHNGSVEIAKKLMRMAKDCGCKMVKFQKRTVDVVYTQAELDKPRDSLWGTTTREQKNGLEFGEVEYQELNQYSKEIGIPWFASCWDLESLEFIERFNPPAHKVASAMITYRKMIEAIAEKRRLTYISTGMLPDLCAVRKAVAIMNYHDCPYVLMHCVGEYPCPPERSNIGMLATLWKEFPGVQIGFSSHAVSPIVGFAAALFGATTIETHITLDRSMYGSDQAASLERPGLQKLVDYCRLAKEIIGDGTKRITEKEMENAKKLRWFNG